jgi:hypothetical protein
MAVRYQNVRFYAVFLDVYHTDTGGQPVRERRI